MKTAVEKMIQYFIEQKNNGASHWCINDLLGQLHQAKAMEKEQIATAFGEGIFSVNKTGMQYYNETFKSK